MREKDSLAQICAVAISQDACASGSFALWLRLIQVGLQAAQPGGCIAGAGHLLHRERHIRQEVALPLAAKGKEEGVEVRQEFWMLWIAVGIAMRVKEAIAELPQGRNAGRVVESR